MNLGLRTVGRASVPVDVEFDRALTPADLEMLDASRESVPPVTVTRLRDRHHALARCLASGMTPTEAAAVTGYDRSRISVLQNDPAMQELISFYRQDVNAGWRDAHEAMASLHFDATTELHDRLTEKPDTFDNSDLMEVMKLTADRTGHGPATKNTNVNVTVDLGSKIEAARQRAQAARQIDVVDAEVIEDAPGR